MCDEEVAAIVLDNDDRSGSSRYARVNDAGIVTEIQEFMFNPPSSEWRPCKPTTAINSPY